MIASPPEEVFSADSSGNPMEIYLAEQVWVFFHSLLLGALLGILYDVFRITRLAFVIPSLLVLLEDLAFFLLSSILLFNYLLQFSHGQIRYFILAGVVLGWILYYCSVGRIVMGVASRFIHVIKQVLRVLCAPFVWIGKKMGEFVNLLLKSLEHLTSKLKINLKLRILMMYNRKNKKGRQN